MRPLSKANQLKLRAMEAGFQNFEADAFRHCLARFEQAIRIDERAKVSSVVRQVLDAGLLAGNPAGLRKRETE